MYIPVIIKMILIDFVMCLFENAWYKSQRPNDKYQIRLKKQIQFNKHDPLISNFLLRIGYCDLFVIWILSFGI